MKKKNKNKRKNNKGFTLIELLAVITILGILMMVAIPAVSRTIENSRRDTFMDAAKSYINAIKNSVAADELKCGGTGTVISAVDSGYYYYPFTTATGNTATDLMEQGGKSSWGNAHVAGEILIYKTVSGTDTKYEYSIMLVDTVGRGIGKATDDGHGALTKVAIADFISESNLARSSVNTSDGNSRKSFYNALSANVDATTAVPENATGTKATKCSIA